MSDRPSSARVCLSVSSLEACERQKCQEACSRATTVTFPRPASIGLSPPELQVGGLTHRSGESKGSTSTWPAAPHARWATQSRAANSGGALGAVAPMIAGSELGKSPQAG
jgi:hypothetical protein